METLERPRHRRRNSGTRREEETFVYCSRIYFTIFWGKYDRNVVEPRVRRVERAGDAVLVGKADNSSVSSTKMNSRRAEPVGFAIRGSACTTLHKTLSQSLLHTDTIMNDACVISSRTLFHVIIDERNARNRGSDDKIHR